MSKANKTPDELIVASLHSSIMSNIDWVYQSVYGLELEEIDEAFFYEVMSQAVINCTKELHIKSKEKTRH